MKLLGEFYRYWYLVVIIGLILGFQGGYNYIMESRFKDHDFVSEEFVEYRNFDIQISPMDELTFGPYHLFEKTLYWLDIGPNASSYFINSYRLNDDLNSVEKTQSSRLLNSPYSDEYELKGLYINEGFIWTIQNHYFKNDTYSSLIINFNLDGEIMNEFILPLRNTTAAESSTGRQLIYANDQYVVFGVSYSDQHIDQIARYNRETENLDYLDLPFQTSVLKLFYTDSMYWTTLSQPYWKEGQTIKGKEKAWYGFDIDFDSKRIELLRVIDDKTDNVRNNNPRNLQKYNIFVDFGVIMGNQMIIPVQSNLPDHNDQLSGLNIYTISDYFQRVSHAIRTILGMSLVLGIVILRKKQLTRKEKPN